MADSISSLFSDCLRSFDALLSRDELALYATEVPTSMWAGELGRLRLWAANIGAHQRGQSSVDYRLREASHIKGQTEDDVPLQDDDETDAQQIYSSLVTTIDCLFQISMIIRRPAQHDRLLGTKRLDTTVFEPYDKQHVGHKYPQADPMVADRLGTAISRRRAALKYRERHRAKLGAGIDQPDAISTTLSETIATEFESHHVDAETRSNSELSQTSAATSLWESDGKITVPHAPQESTGGKEFECPYCFFIITISDRNSWVRHVFKDLMPYVCVFLECSVAYRLYDSRREWFQHLRTSHLREPTIGDNDCPLRCGATLPGLSLERHLGRHLQELALFALPRTEEPDEGDPNESHGSLSEATVDHDVSGDSSEDEEPNRNSEARFPCTRPGCRKEFHRVDLLQRHLDRHDLEDAVRTDQGANTAATRINPRSDRGIDRRGAESNSIYQDPVTGESYRAVRQVPQTPSGQIPQIPSWQMSSQSPAPSRNDQEYASRLIRQPAPTARGHEPIMPESKEYFCSGDGIDREVIQHWIVKYLGDDATYRPGQDTYGRSGYLIRAYRPLTTAMERSLREETIMWQRERERRARQGRSQGTYGDMLVRQERELELRHMGVDMDTDNNYDYQPPSRYRDQDPGQSTASKSSIPAPPTRRPE
ncbi:hypothetical protein PV11_08921 [Exophiala sideris]|uniref:C2H2-type domain-containing protein n=1 Tax=Exophiala sideris TaxID=1016849 RepID=A0A0D1WPT1_9EURO|nr:hypothetical protein PV11_08921 [Exophiala sideris]